LKSSISHFFIVFRFLDCHHFVQAREAVDAGARVDPGVDVVLFFSFFVELPNFRIQIDFRNRIDASFDRSNQAFGSELLVNLRFKVLLTPTDALSSLTKYIV
jgi:hypothetical protein